MYPKITNISILYLIWFHYDRNDGSSQDKWIFIADSKSLLSKVLICEDHYTLTKLVARILVVIRNNLSSLNRAKDGECLIQ